MHIRIQRHIHAALRGAVAPNLGRRLFDFFCRRTQASSGLRHIETNQRHVAGLAGRPWHCRRGGDRAIGGGYDAGRRDRSGGRRLPHRLTGLLCAGLRSGCGGRLPPGRGTGLPGLVIGERPLPCIAGGEQSAHCQQARDGDRPGNGALHGMSRSYDSVTQNLSACSLAVCPRSSCIRQLLRVGHSPSLPSRVSPFSNPDRRCGQGRMSCAPNAAVEIQFAAAVVRSSAE